MRPRTPPMTGATPAGPSSMNGFNRTPVAGRGTVPTARRDQQTTKDARCQVSFLRHCPASEAVGSLTTNGVLATLVSFNGFNGGKPSGLVEGVDHRFYGTTRYGGLSYNGAPFSGHGAIFRMTTNGALTALFFFSGTNGSRPDNGLVQGADGNFYGTTTEGGTNKYYVNGGGGTIFQMTTNFTLTTLISFGRTNGAGPLRLLQIETGDFYGTTYYGSTNYDGTNPGGTNDHGTFFRLSGFTPLNNEGIFLSAPTYLPGGQFQFTLKSSNGTNYTLQYSTTLTNWISILTFSGSGSSMLITDSNSVGAAQRFYRVVVF